MLRKVWAAYRQIGSLFFCLLIYGCAATPQTDKLIQSIPESFARPVELINVPFYPQKEYQCGPAALATVLGHMQRKIDLQQLTDRVYIPARKGSLQLEMIAAIRDHELIPFQIQQNLASLVAYVKAGYPVLVLQNLGVSWYPQWHYAVVVGFDLDKRELILRSGTTKRYVMSLHTFEHTWRRSQFWGLIVFQPGELPVTDDPESARRYFQAVAGFEQSRNWGLLDKAYRTGLQNWPQHVDLLLGFGNNLYQLDQKQQALEQYEKVILINPESAVAYNNAAQVLAEMGNFQQALAYANRAIEFGGVHIEQFKSTLSDIKKMQKQN